MTTDTQRQKAAAVLGELLAAYGDLPASKITRFEGHVVNELKQRPDVLTFGVDGQPDRITSLALKKAGLEDSAFTDVIMLTFSADDKIVYLLDGKQHER